MTPVEVGCTDADFLEYNPSANTDDGSCLTPVVVGCLDSEACNYNSDANTAGDCEYPLDLYGVTYVDCDGACLNDGDGDGVCDEDEVAGCMDELAVNFDAAATDEDGSCLYPGCTDPLYIEYDADADVDDGTCATLVLEGCTDSAYLEYDADANVDDGSCQVLAVFGCTDALACNYSGGYNTDDGSCIYASDIYGSDLVDCFGNCLNDADGDGVCDADEVAGCTDQAACNYSPTITEDDGSCEYCSCYEPEVIPGPDSLYFESDSAGYGLELVRVAAAYQRRPCWSDDVSSLHQGAKSRGQTLKCLWKWRLASEHQYFNVMVSGSCRIELWIVDQPVVVWHYSIAPL